MTLRLNVRQNGQEINLSVFVLKGLLTQAVCNKFTAVFGADVIADSTVTKYLYQRQLPSILFDYPEEPAAIVIDQASLDAFEHYPLSSIRELVCLARIPTITIHRHLMHSLGFMVKHFS
jgi:hypothetical protein